MGRKSLSSQGGIDVDSLPNPATLDDLAELLRIQRGFSEPEWRRFLLPTPPMKLKTTDYFDQSTIDKAVELIRKHAQSNSTILIFGDYDADGVCATAVLWEALDSAGIRATPFLPNRFRHGYGLTDQAVKEILAFEKRPDLIITVDTGIGAVEAIGRLKQEGIEILLTDHHQESDQGTPTADVILHNTALCGTTVSWFLAREFSAQSAVDSLELCGLATMADQVPHAGANRSFAKHGVEAMKKTRRVGMIAMLDAVGLKQRFLDGRSMQFKLIPPLNAFGRMDDPIEALRLICARNPQKARELARKAVEINTQRREQTTSMTQVAYQRLSEQFGDLAVIYDQSFHEGLIGLLAGNLSEQTRKPTIVIAPSRVDDQMLKGSVRSIPGVNVVELLSAFSDLLPEFGGHAMAGGFSVSRSNLDLFLEKIRAVRLGDNLLFTDERNESGRLPLCGLRPALLTPDTTALIEELEPFGQQNPQPFFYVEDVEPLSTAPLSRSGEHFKHKIRVGGEVEMELLEFGDESIFSDLLVKDDESKKLDDSAKSVESLESVELTEDRPKTISLIISLQHKHSGVVGIVV